MLAKVVRQLREANGWTQAGLARLAGVSQQLIAKIENQKVVESRKLPRIARAFGLTVDQLLSRTAESESIAKAKKYGDAEVWPFRFTRERWDRLRPAQRKHIEEEVERMLRLCEAGVSEPREKTAAGQHTRQRRMAG